MISLWMALLACSGDKTDDSAATGCPAAVPGPQTADLDGDGAPDLAFAQTEDASGSYRATSPVLWGEAGWTTQTDYPSTGADDVAMADLDGDGWPELILASVSDGEARAVDSLVYRGSAAGPVADDPITLPGVGASAVTVYDVDQDGHLDLFLSNRYDGEGFSEASYTVDSTLYLGSADGPSEGRALSVETLGAADARFGDLDQDGWTDLVVASGTLFADTSQIFRGGADGFSPWQALPTEAPEGVELADWNGDGWLDIFFSNFYADFALDIDSPLYWGGPDGYAADRVSWIPTHGATEALAADLDGDGCLELVVANAMTGSFTELQYATDSEVWRGSPDGPTEIWASLPTTSAAAASAGDLDGDGDLDLVFANRYSADGEVGADSVIYWNDAGFSADDRLLLPTTGAAGVTAHLD